jgi:hypothetical protein
LTLQQAWKAAAVLFTIFAAIAGLIFFRLKWAPGVDFDVTGFFWVIRNVGRLSVLVLFIASAGAALSFWIRAYLAGR